MWPGPPVLLVAAAEPQPGLCFVLQNAQPGQMVLIQYNRLGGPFKFDIPPDQKITLKIGACNLRGAAVVGLERVPEAVCTAGAALKQMARPQAAGQHGEGAQRATSAALAAPLRTIACSGTVSPTLHSAPTPVLHPVLQATTGGSSPRM